MYKVVVEQDLDIPRQKVFNALVQFGGIEKILPDMIESVEVTGSGVGAVRNVALKDGGTVVERLDVAHGESVFAYSIIFNDALPVDNYCAVVTLEDSGSGTTARWGSNWDLKGDIAEEEAKNMFTELYGNLLDGLPKLI